MADVPAALAAIVGAANVLTDADAVAGHVVDWTGRFGGPTPAVVRPADTDEVASVVRWCAANAVAVVPQGGNTGLVGGSVPRGGEVVLSLRRLRDLGALDPASGQLTVGAGATLESVQADLRSVGREFAVDLAARGTATIGGMVATNAGGTRVIRHGPMRNQVAGVEAVLGDGAVVSHLAGLEKDNTGYDLAGLLCGSEGTLGVITRVRLRTVPLAGASTTVLLGLDDVEAALACVVAARDGGAPLDAAEVFFHDGLRLVCDHLGIAPPFRDDPPVYLLLEGRDRTDPTDALLGALEPVTPAVRETAVATTEARRADLWRFREAHTESINARGVPHKLDVTIPLQGLARFCDEVRAVVQGVGAGLETYQFGHLGDGNIHVNVVAPGASVPDAVDGAVLDLVADAGGSISAEHGIGIAKVAFLHLNRTAEELAAFRRIKAALDPADILNPGVLLPVDRPATG